MDGSLGAGDLLTVALLAAAASWMLRLLLWPPTAHKQPAGPVAPPAAQDPLGSAAQRKGTATDLPHKPPPDGAHAKQPARATPLADAAARVTVEGQAQGLAAHPAPAAALLVGGDPAALSAAAAATERYLLEFIVGQGFPTTQLHRATCSAPSSTWPPAQIVVLGNVEDRTRQAAVHLAALAHVPLLLVARHAPTRA